MSEMVERVARILARQNNCSEVDHRFWSDDAREIIEAMREPTLAMAEAPYKRADEIPQTDPPMWPRAYQLMIDAALAAKDTRQ